MLTQAEINQRLELFVTKLKEGVNLGVMEQMVLNSFIPVIVSTINQDPEKAVEKIQDIMTAFMWIFGLRVEFQKEGAE